MFSNNSNQGKLVLRLTLGLLCLGSNASAQQAKRPFTVADDIGLTLFNTQGGSNPEVHFSPDGKYVAVWSEHGRLDLNQVEDSLRFYRTQELQAFLQNGGSETPGPSWIVTLSGKQNPIIDQDHWNWLADSSGVAFLKLGYDGPDVTEQLMVAELRKKVVELLTPSAEDVRGFDVRDRQHYCYVVADRRSWLEKKHAESQAGAFVGTGVDMWRLLFPDDPTVRRWDTPVDKELWAVVDGRRFAVKHNGVPPDFDENVMALSPDGRSIATLAPVDNVPPSWGTLYPPPPFLGYAHPIKAGHGNAKQYVRIDLRSGSMQSLTDAPFIGDIGVGYRPEGITPAWSSNGQEVLLPETFLKSKENVPGRPCIAIADLRSNSMRCIAMLKVRGYDKNDDPGDDDHPATDTIASARFSPDDNQKVVVTFLNRIGGLGRTTQYEHSPDGTWKVARETKGEIGPGGLEVKITQTFKDPPLLVAANKETSRALWDPNPQLKDIELAQVSIYKWKDVEGRDWEGSLYKPSNYQTGRRYPLVVQTHGFWESTFVPSGSFSTAFAAQEMAAAGIMVLQTERGDRPCELNTTAEGLCSVGYMKAAADQLVSEGLVDPERIGIIGFSRTCYYVMEALTTNALHLRAASITDGLMADYFQYVFGSGGDEEFEKMLGAKPFGEGLQQWLKRSPGFNLDKVNTPLLVNAPGRLGVLEMWLPYAELHYLQKPVELMVINTREHILTNPLARMASQGGSVDWFRFWLQDYEDPDPAKTDQYKRWRALRTLQKENEKKSETPSALVSAPGVN